MRRPLTRVRVRPAPRPNSAGNCWPLPLGVPLPAARFSAGLEEVSWFSACAALTKPRSVRDCWSTMTTGAEVSVALRRMREPVTTTSSSAASAAVAASAEVCACTGAVAASIAGTTIAWPIRTAKDFVMATPLVFSCRRARGRGSRGSPARKSTESRELIFSIANGPSREAHDLFRVRAEIGAIVA